MFHEKHLFARKTQPPIAHSSAIMIYPFSWKNKALGETWENKSLGFIPCSKVAGLSYTGFEIINYVHETKEQSEHDSTYVKELNFFTGNSVLKHRTFRP